MDEAGAPKPFPAMFKKTFKAEGDVVSVKGNRITLEGADLNAGSRFEAFLPNDALVIQVGPKTIIRNGDGDKVTLKDVKEGDSLAIKGKLLPSAKWVGGEGDEADTPVLDAKKITIDD